MNTTGDNTNLTDQGKDLANKAADKIQAGSKSLGEEARNQFSGKGKTLARNVEHSIDEVTGKAQGLAKQGWDTIDTAVQQVRDTAADMSDSLTTYTKDSPGKALLMAAASGALLVALIKALTPSRD
jgi:ElaB/YqjD/DUF883 family membrane-anchored ribosome-binding protein